MSKRRMERINSLLLQEISRYVVERQIPEIGFITFTEVRVTDDLSQARVFYSVLGNEDEKAASFDALRRLTPELRRSMRHLESLRIIPNLEFVYDETPERAARVFEVLEDIHKQEEGAAPPPPAAPKDEDEGRPGRKKKK
jgi:ribosome-binding factor A